MDHLQQHEEQGCQHHWMIEPARSQESHGRCTSCRTERVFSNAPVSRYDRDAVPRMDRDFRASARSSHRERIELSDEG